MDQDARREENLTVIGRMHLTDGLVAERTADGGIRLGLTHGGDVFNKHTPVLWFNFDESQFASLVAHVSRRGERGETFLEALALLQKQVEQPPAEADPIGVKG